MKRKELNSLTEGALFGAIYAVILLAVRYFMTSTDSLIYYFIPLPLVIYTLRNKISYSIILFFVISAVSFLFSDIYRTLLLLIPNYLIGLVMGIFKRKVKMPLLEYITIFILCFIASYLSIYAYTIMSGIDYFTSTMEELNFIKNIFPSISNDFFKRIILLIIPIILVIDALMKTVMLVLLLILINRKLNLFEGNKYFKLIFHPLVTIIYLFVTLLFVLSLSFGLDRFNYFDRSMIIVFGSMFFIYSIYLMYQFIYFTAFVFQSKRRRGLGILVSLISFILFPISIIGGLVVNLLPKIY